jgi:Elongation factor G, domain IV
MNETSAGSSGLVFENRTVGGGVPAMLVAAVEKALARCMSEGTLAGYPVIGLKRRRRRHGGRFEKGHRADLPDVCLSRHGGLDATIALGLFMTRRECRLGRELQLALSATRDQY